jgi:hypothetical protein
LAKTNAERKHLRSSNAPRIDWTQIINDLVGRGISLAEISTALKVARSAPYRWLEGSEPLYSNGRLLLALHSRQRELRSGILGNHVVY